MRADRPLRVLALLALLLAGCANSGANRIERSIERGEIDQQPTAASERQVHLDLIRRMLDQKQYYAALAHIEAQTRTAPPSDALRLLEAEARRKLGQTAAAQQLYTGLLKTRFDAEAYHGLGLMLVPTNLPLALGYLKRAVDLRPTSVEMRNDLGYGFMLGRRYPDALTQLATAVELDPGGDKSRNNLVILMILMRDESAVQRIVRESGMDANTLAGLRRQAQNVAAQQFRPASATAGKPGAG